MKAGFHRSPLPGGAAARGRLVLAVAPLVLFFLLTVGWGSAFAAVRAFRAVGSHGALVLLRELAPSLLLTVRVAALSSVASVCIGAAGAYLLWRAPRAMQIPGGVYRLPVMLPHIAVAYLTILFWGQTGLVSAMLMRLGIIGESSAFPSLLFGRRGTGMVLAYIYKGFPFVMLMALGVLERVPRGFVSAARVLGAREVRTFFQVILPQMGAVLVQSGVMLFLFALGGFEIPWLLGGTFPRMVPVTVFQLFFHGTVADQDVAFVLLFCMVVVSALLGLLALRVMQRLTPWEKQR